MINQLIKQLSQFTPIIAIRVKDYYIYKYKPKFIEIMNSKMYYNNQNRF